MKFLPVKIKRTDVEPPSTNTVFVKLTLSSVPRLKWLAKFNGNPGDTLVTAGLGPVVRHNENVLTVKVRADHLKEDVADLKTRVADANAKCMQDAEVEEDVRLKRKQHEAKRNAEGAKVAALVDEALKELVD